MSHIDGRDSYFGAHQIGPPGPMPRNFKLIVFTAPCSDFVDNRLVSIHLMHVYMQGAIASFGRRQNHNICVNRKTDVPEQAVVVNHCI